MCCNTNECGCSLFNSLFNLNRSGCNSCCSCNGWNGWNGWNRSCGCNSCGCNGWGGWNRSCGCNSCGCNACTQGTTVTTNGNGCGNAQFFSIPVSGRLFLRVGNRSGWNCGCNSASTFNNFDSYYARQYGLTSFGNSRSCGCSND